MNITRPNKHLTHLSYTTLVKAVTHDVGLYGSCVLSVVWGYCNLKNGRCTASIATIAYDLNVSYNTVLRNIKVLCDKGYLVDLTPKVRNEPHTYAATNKVVFNLGSYSFSTEDDIDQLDQENDEFIVDTNGQSATELFNG